MIEIIPYQDRWPKEFLEIGLRIREQVGDHALAIHHIGSTSVPGLAAKDVIDIQLTVADLDAPIRPGLEAIGFACREGIHRDHCPPGMDIRADQLEKRYFSGIERRIHLHVRAEGRYNQRYALRCRDFLRTHAMAAHAYAEIKRQLACHFPDNADAYYDIKDPVFDVIMAGAFEWAETTSWQPAPTDA